MLELKNITKNFGSVVANNDVSISIKKGTIHAIVGENGAGKSTIMRVAYGFYTADSGEIFVDGKPVSIKNPHDAIRLGIGMVASAFYVGGHDDGRRKHYFGRGNGGGGEIWIWKRRTKIFWLYRMNCGWALIRRLLIENLSVGAQQRVELLKALYRHTPIC